VQIQKNGRGGQTKCAGLSPAHLRADLWAAKRLEFRKAARRSAPALKNRSRQFVACDKAEKKAQNPFFTFYKNVKGGPAAQLLGWVVMWKERAWERAKETKQLVRVTTINHFI
jgi:hypothetical protein